MKATCAARLAVLVGAVALLAAGARAAAPLQTPLERAGYSRISSSAEISRFLEDLAAATPLARLEVVGTSNQGRPIEALVLADPAAVSAGGRMTVMVIGSQHGAAEPAGGEALLVIARELVFGDLQPLLRALEVVLVPNANPDGRDLRRRANANRININTDFVLALEPETRALKQALKRYAPAAVLDSHESAILKRKTLAREGYLTDFEAQFEIANHPAIPAALRRLALEDLLPALIARVSAAHVPAQRYIGEITSIAQPITNGGLTLRNFRNTAGLSGAVSLLVETKLDSREDAYPTYRNIGVRLQKQLVCIREFLHLAHERRADISRQAAARSIEPLALYARYVEDPAHPRVSIALRRLDNRVLEPREFRDHRRLETADEIAMPATYLVVAHADELRPVLDTHDIRYETLADPLTANVVAQRFARQVNITEQVAVLASEVHEITAPAGSLVIDLGQPNGRLAVLLLDPRSTSSVFRYAEFARLTSPEHAHWVYPVFKGVVAKH